jgi:hypothetical protein
MSDEEHNGNHDDREPTKTSSSYLDLVKAEISFARATGTSKDAKTVVVPLTELAIRQEGRLRGVPKREITSSGADIVPEKDTTGKRMIPMGEIIDVLRAARSIEEVAGVLVEIIANLIPRVLLLWERDEVLHGFAARGMDLPEVKLLTIEMPRSILTEMTGLELELDSYRGPPQEGELVSRFFSLLEVEPPEILLVPCYVTPQDRWVLYADNGTSHLPLVEERLIEVIVSRAGARADLLLDIKKE